MISSKQHMIPADVPTILRGLRILNSPHAEIGGLICQVTVIPGKPKGTLVHCVTPFGPKWIEQSDLRNHAPTTASPAA